MGWGNGLKTLYGPRMRTLGEQNLPSWGVGQATDRILLSLLISPDPGVFSSQASFIQFTATGSYNDSTTQDDTTNATWTVSTTPFMTVGASNGQVTPTTWGQLNGGAAGVTASIGAVSDDVVARIVAYDSGSLRVYMPQSDAQWQALGLSPWGGWWGCQEASGTDLVGSGSVPFTLTQTNDAVNARCLWQEHPRADWVRNGVSISGTGGNNTGWLAPAGTGPNIQNTSVAMLGYIFCGGNIGAARFHFGYSGPASNQQMWGVNLQVSGVPRIVSSGTFVGAVSNHVDGRFHPFLIVLDLTNGRSKMYTDLDKVTGSFPSTAYYDGTKGFGGGTGLSATTGTLVYAAYCTGSVAERLSLNGPASDFLKRLGWTNTPW